MGFNLSGFIITPAEVQKEVLEAALGLQLQGPEAIIFETATLNNYGETFFDVFHAPGGTLVLCDTPWFENSTGLEKLSANGQVISFELSETSMAFFFTQYENGRQQWEDGIVFEDTVMRYGSGALKMDENTDVVFDTFGPLCAARTGINFHDIPLNAPALRYRARKAPAQPEPLPDEPGATPPPDPEIIFAAFEKLMMQVVMRRKEKSLAIQGKHTVYSFEHFLTREGHQPATVQQWCAFFNANEKAYHEWQNKKTAALMQNEKNSKKGSAYIKMILVAAAAFSLVYSLVAVVLGVFGVNLWLWSYYAAAAAALLLLLLAIMAVKVHNSRNESVSVKVFNNGPNLNTTR